MTGAEERLPEAGANVKYYVHGPDGKLTELVTLPPAPPQGIGIDLVPDEHHPTDEGHGDDGGLLE